MKKSELQKIINRVIQSKLPKETLFFPVTETSDTIVTVLENLFAVVWDKEDAPKEPTCPVCKHHKFSSETNSDHVQCDTCTWEGLYSQCFGEII